MSLIKFTKAFICDEGGLTVVEYVVGAGVMIVGFSGLFVAFKDIFINEFNTIFGS